MKKVLVAAAGLMLAGTMVSTAMADVTFSGDARVRYYNQSDYNAFDSKAQVEADGYVAKDSNDFFNERVRLQWKATTKGGAYAVGRFRLADTTLNGTTNTRAGGEKSNLYIDKAYIGVPMGPVTFEGGLSYRSVTPFFYYDNAADFVQVKYAADNTNLVAFYDILEEEDISVTGNDSDRFGAVLNQKFGGGWAMTAGAMYVSDDADEGNEGFMGTINVSGDVGVGLEAEISFIESDLAGGTDDAMGGFIAASMPLGAASLTATAGFANDGFVVDDDFASGFVIYGDASQIGGNAIGADGDTSFFSLAASFKASEKLTLGASVGYADTDNLDGIFDIGATAAYAVTDGATLKAIAGYADVDTPGDTNADNPFGFGLSLEIAY
ncbi:hypothetical protein [Desulfosediminicola flagellatus]|uniref:hypothetical protein n=1 Tax=Desulfosediminicola flagellatus TaxID=2569541 RepID=UPI0010AD128A|nr:hypothetical protein [Desulfosediminicola flagellatus]